MPEHAIDGNRASIWNQRSCTHTKRDLNPWWRVDLRTAYKVNYVKITNRKDCCANRINGAEIRIGNSPTWNDNKRYSICIAIWMQAYSRHPYPEWFIISMQFDSQVYCDPRYPSRRHRNIQLRRDDRTLCLRCDSWQETIPDSGWSGGLWSGFR